MDSNFSITINTLTFVNMSSYIFRYNSLCASNRIQPDNVLMLRYVSNCKPRFSFNSVSQCPLEFDFCFQFILSKTYNSLR